MGVTESARRWQRGGWLLLAASLGFAGCSTSRPSAPVPSASPGRLKLSAPSRPHVTTASWYGPGFEGRRTSSGEVFDSDNLTAASRTLPMGSRVRVTNLNSGKSVVVRINDRGPFVRGRGIDLSQAAAKRIGIARRGIARVEITRIDSTASASLAPVAPAAPERWSGRARVRKYTVRRHRTYRNARGAPSRKIISNPVGTWLLEMVH